MSLEQAKAFIEKMKSDAAFRARAMGIEDVDARLAFIKSQGFNFTKDEIRQVNSELAGQKSGKAVGGLFDISGKGDCLAHYYPNVKCC